MNKVVRNNLHVKLGDLVNVHQCLDIKYGKHVHILPSDDSIHHLASPAHFPKLVSSFQQASSRGPVRFRHTHAGLAMSTACLVITYALHLYPAKFLLAANTACSSSAHGPALAPHSTTSQAHSSPAFGMGSHSALPVVMLALAASPTRSLLWMGMKTQPGCVEIACPEYPNGPPVRERVI